VDTAHHVWTTRGNTAAFKIKTMTHRPPRKRLIRVLTRPPFRDEAGRKGVFRFFSRAQRHLVQRLDLAMAGWPRWPRALRVALLSDFHTGSHAGDVERLTKIVAEASAFAPDLALYGGDFVNMQPWGGGRVPPHIIAAILARLPAPLGRFAIIGNHDVSYGAALVADALRGHGIAVLDDEETSFRFEGSDVGLVGVPDGNIDRDEARTLVTGLPPRRPTIILSHDPVWFADVQCPSHLMLAGHTHGGQICLPGIGPLTNASRAPLRWSHGHIVENGRQLFVTSGLGTSGIPLRIGAPPEFVLLDVNGPPGLDR
jgi:predicted MPP superfamily phosphohydrolase